MCSRQGAHFGLNSGYYIGNEKNGKIVAVTGFDNYNGASISMHIAGDGKRWMTKEYLWFCFYYPFEQLKVKKIVGLVSSANQDAMRFDLHLGFVHEATIKDAHPDGDLNVLTMTKDQCKFLTIRRP